MNNYFLKWLFGLLIFGIATIAVLWLAGFLFFAFYKVNPINQTDILTWWTYWQYYGDDEKVFSKLIRSLGFAALLVYGLLATIIFAQLRKVRELHGSARFASSREIAAADLYSDNGILIGRHQNKYLMFPGMQFVMLSAPTRSGKGVSVVIPNLLNYPDSAVVTDIKLENFLITSKYREKCGQKVYLFNPFCITDGTTSPAEGRTHRYNPLGYISDNPRLRVTDALSIAYVFYPDEKDFFDSASRNLFLGLVLYLFETPNLPRTIGELLRQSSGKGQPVKEYLQNIINTRNYKETETLDDSTGELTKKLTPITNWDGEGLSPLSNECVDALNRFINTSENTLTSILATFNSALTIWASPVIDAATSANDFDLREIRKQRMTIYIGIPANKLAESREILNLFYTQLISLNLDRLLHSTPELKHPCLLLNDEFTAPGRIGIIDKSNAFLAGYGLRLLTIIQSTSQLEDRPPRGYGTESARTLVSNHACKVVFTPSEQMDANKISEMLGYETVKAKSTNRQLSVNTRRGESISDQRRALMMPQELRELGQTSQIISLENVKPILCEKITYYSDPVFMDRLKSVSPSLQAISKKLSIRSGMEQVSKRDFEIIWGKGEMATKIPMLDLDLFDAITETRVREMTADDITEEGIDLNRICLDTSGIKVLNEGETLAPEEIEDFVDQFFNSLDDASSHISDDSADHANLNTETHINVDDGVRIDLSLLESPTTHTESMQS